MKQRKRTLFFVYYAKNIKNNQQPFSKTDEPMGYNRQPTTMKQKLLTLFLALAASVGTLFAKTYGGACGTSLTWTLTTDDGVLVISGNGEMLNYSSSSSPWYAYRTSITAVNIPNSVTYIGDYAFSGCSGLTSITCEAITPPSLGVSYYGDAYHCAVFDNVDRTISLYVPTQSLYDYTNAIGWKNFKNIQPIPYSTPEIYNINFVNYDGSELQSGEVESGTMPEYNGATPTRPADAQYTYAFSGWTPEIVAVTGDATYTAMFEETLNTYTITWQDESGNVIRTDEVGYGLTPELTGPTPTKEGYDFVGWLPNIKPATENTKYTTYFIPQAQAEEKVYTVNINGENCSLNINNQYPEGTVITIEAVADECFEFQQWSDGNKENPRTITVTANTNLTAEFNKVRYTVTGEPSTGGKVQIHKQ